MSQGAKIERDPTRILIAGLVTIGMAAGIALSLLLPSPVSDELFHREQIRWFMDGRWQLRPVIAMIPGYHLLVAGVGRVFGEYSDVVSRLITLAGGLLLLPLAHGIVAQSRPGEAAMRTAQVFFLPLLYPFFFLIYTDTWGLVALCAMLLAVLRGRTVLAALAGVAAIAIRQDFIIWVVFVLMILAWENETWGGRMSVAFRRGWPLVLVGVAFGGFLVWNHGAVAIGDQDKHVHPFDITNLYIFLLLAFVVFLPYHLSNGDRIRALLRRKSVVVLVALGFALYWVTYSSHHIYNQSPFWLHNDVLLWMNAMDWLRAILYLPMAWAALSFASTPMPETRFAALYILGPLSVVLHPFVEPRYYLPSFLLFACWRPPIARRWEWLTLFAYVAISFYLLWGIAQGQFFL
jgi:alpha-1,2-glucosyltransferase